MKKKEKLQDKRKKKKNLSVTLHWEKFVYKLEIYIVLQTYSTNKIMYFQPRIPFVYTALIEGSMNEPLV